MKQLLQLHILFVALPVCFLTGCFGSGGSVDDFRNEDPKVRISAIKQAGREKQDSAIPHLIDRLSDSEAEVRMFAIVALKEITGLTHGYQHYDSAADRDSAIEEWRKWLAEKVAKSDKP